jgi:pimeloyl-ACP methyl ester carboxylesterase
MSMTDPQTPVDTGYAPINDLRMYYEIYGEGRPLILLHGAYMTIDTMGPILPGLAATRQVIAAEQQGHGHTADIDRSITYEQMADDTAALLAHLDIGEADVFGFSMGGGIALQLAIRHPGVVGKLVVASTSYTSDGMHQDDGRPPGHAPFPAGGTAGHGALRAARPWTSGSRRLGTGTEPPVPRRTGDRRAECGLT